jgi:hypothetical protein
MFHFKSKFSAVVLGAALLPSAATATYFMCQDGIAFGDWDLPSGVGSPGFLSGKLADPTGSYGIYAFDAVLTDVPTPCLSCVEGTISGTLDDGIGPGPDYDVVGEYSGFFFTGKGKFFAKIVPPGSNTSVGVVEGKFEDPPFPGGIGKFKGKWEICP